MLDTVKCEICGNTNDTLSPCAPCLATQSVWNSIVRELTEEVEQYSEYHRLSQWGK